MPQEPQTLIRLAIAGGLAAAFIALKLTGRIAASWLWLIIPLSLPVIIPAVLNVRMGIPRFQQGPPALLLIDDDSSHFLASDPPTQRGAGCEL